MYMLEAKTHFGPFIKLSGTQLSQPGGLGSGSVLAQPKA